MHPAEWQRFKIFSDSEIIERQLKCFEFVDLFVYLSLVSPIDGLSVKQTLQHDWHVSAVICVTTLIWKRVNSDSNN